jgi:hypothetical protein
MITLRPTSLVTFDGAGWARIFKGKTETGIELVAIVHALGVVDETDAPALAGMIENAVGPDRIVPYALVLAAPAMVRPPTRQSGACQCV